MFGNKKSCLSVSLGFIFILHIIIIRVRRCLVISKWPILSLEYNAIIIMTKETNHRKNFRLRFFIYLPEEHNLNSKLQYIT